MSFNLLPVGRLRLLDLTDVSNRTAPIVGQPGFDTASSYNALAGFTNAGMYFANTRATNTAETENISLKAPTDRTWYLIRIAVGANANLNHTSTAKSNGIVVDQQTLASYNLIMNIGGGNTISWNNMYGYPVTAQVETPYPLGLDAGYALPIRNQVTINLESDPSNGEIITLYLWVWVWESLKITPALEPVTTIPAQTVNQSWSNT